VARSASPVRSYAEVAASLEHDAPPVPNQVRTVQTRPVQRDLEAPEPKRSIASALALIEDVRRARASGRS
jgi:hypothetical protein